MKITTHKKKNGATVYRASIYLGVDDLTGKKIKKSITGRTKKEVKQKILQAKVDFKANGSTVQKRIKVKTFRELTDLWLESYKLTVKPQTLKNITARINAHILPIFGDKKLDKILPIDIQILVNELATYYVHYGSILNLISRIYRYGIILNLATSNPASNVILPRRQIQPKERVKFIDPSDLKKLLAYMKNHAPLDYAYYFDDVLYSLLLATGCRIGEVIALEWADIDLINATITINKTYNDDIKSVSTTKTKSGNRTISIDQKTVTMLRLYQVRQGQIFSEVGSPRPRVVFATPTRDYFLIRTGLQRLKKYCQTLEITPFSFHAFRHTHASLLLNAGISPKELQYRLGHTNISMTLDVYGHISKEKEKHAVTYFEKAINNL